MLFRDILLGVAVPVLWGVGFTLAKPAVGHFPPLLMMTIAYVATAAVLIPGAGAFRTPWWALALIAALAAALQGGLIFNGFRQLPASTAILVVQLQVPFAVLCAWLLGRDRPDLRVASMKARMSRSSSAPERWTPRRSGGRRGGGRGRSAGRTGARPG